MTQSLLLVGCGKMGGALLAGWLNKGVARDAVSVIEPIAGDTVKDRFHVAVAAAPDALDADFAPGVVVFAVKPQGMEDIAPQYRRFVRPSTVFLSIAAGRTIGFLESHLGAAAAVVRSMPNTPAAVGRGITVACANTLVSAEQRAACHALLEAVGEVAWVDDESLLDAVTAVSGSGPAYVFLLIECLAQAEVQGRGVLTHQGLTGDDATYVGALGRLNRHGGANRRAAVAFLAQLDAYPVIAGFQLIAVDV